MGEHSVQHAPWRRLALDEFYEIARLRGLVFGLEQHVTDEDLDGRDREPATEHWWVPDADTGIAGYLRVVAPLPGEVSPPAQTPATRVIGRVATHPHRRGRGVATALLRAVLAEHQSESFVLHAQQHAASLYAQQGFVRFGEAYLEAGIVHVGMYRPVSGT